MPRSSRTSPRPPGRTPIGAVMDDATYVRWIQLDQYGMVAVFVLFFIFRDQFSVLMGDTLVFVRDVMDVLVLSWN